MLNNNLSTVLKMVTKVATEDLWTTLSNGTNQMLLITNKTTDTLPEMDHANRPNTPHPKLEPQVIMTSLKAFLNLKLLSPNNLSLSLLKLIKWLGNSTTVVF